MGAWFGLGIMVAFAVVFTAIVIYERGVDKAHNARRAEFDIGRKNLEEQLERLNLEEEE